MEEALAKVHELLDKVEQKLEELSDKVNSVLSNVPAALGWVVDKFQAAWSRMLEKVGEFWQKVSEFISWMGVPWDLNDAKSRWLSLSNHIAARSVDMGSSRVDNAWRGRAADAYAESIDPQKRALEAIQPDLTNPIATALGDLAGAIYVFWAGLAAALVALVLAIIGASAAGATIVGLPAAPVAVIGGIATALVAIAGTMVNLNSNASSAATEFTKVSNAVGAFGSKHWPTATFS